MGIANNLATKKLSLRKEKIKNFREKNCEATEYSS